MRSKVFLFRLLCCVADTEKKNKKIPKYPIPWKTDKSPHLPLFSWYNRFLVFYRMYLANAFNHLMFFQQCNLLHSPFFFWFCEENVPKPFIWVILYFLEKWGLSIWKGNSTGVHYNVGNICLSMHVKMTTFSKDSIVAALHFTTLLCFLWSNSITFNNGRT